MSNVLQGVEASRRAGWRSYYRAQEEVDRLKQALAIPRTRADVAAEACAELLRDAARAFLMSGGRYLDDSGYVPDFVILAEQAFSTALRGWEDHVESQAEVRIGD